MTKNRPSAERDEKKPLLASDHAGFELKAAVKAELLRQAKSVKDCGSHH